MNIKRIVMIGGIAGLVAGLIGACFGMVPCCLTKFGVTIFTALAGLIGGGAVAYMDEFEGVEDDAKVMTGAKLGAAGGAAASIISALIGFFGSLIVGFLINVAWVAIQMGDPSYIFDMLGTYVIGLIGSAIFGIVLALVGALLGTLLGAGAGAAAASTK